MASDGSSSGAGGTDESIPILCENCLGDNPYVRMQKREAHSQCAICTRTVPQFVWKAGRNGRHKHTVICRTCALLKRACMSCVKDLDYGLPIKLRDEIIAKHAGSAEVAPGAGTVMPRSERGRAMFAAQAERRVSGDAESAALRSAIPAAARAELESLARRGPNYESNKPRLCTFFLRGACRRGAECPYSHEIPDDYWENREFYQADVTTSIRDRYFGVADVAADKLGKKHKERMEAIAAPESSGPLGEGTSTLLVCGEGVSEDDVRGALYAYGEIRQVQRQNSDVIAVEFESQEGAKAAMGHTVGRLVLSGKRLRIRWPNIQNGLLGSDAAPTTSSSLSIPPPPPPTSSSSSTTAIPMASWMPPPPPGAPPPPPEDMLLGPKVAAGKVPRERRLAKQTRNQTATTYPSMKPSFHGSHT